MINKMCLHYTHCITDLFHTHVCILHFQLYVERHVMAAIQQ